MSLVAITNSLKPFEQYLQQEGVTELCINEPSYLWVECHGKFTRVAMPNLTLNYLETLAQVVATFNNQVVNRNKPLLSGNLPSGERIEIVLSPASQQFVLAIRRQQIRDLSLTDYETAGAFDSIAAIMSDNDDFDANLLKYYKAKNYSKFLQAAIVAKKNILISGGTGTGKTTFLNACLKSIPAHERIITVEDNREVRVIQPNCVHLVAARTGQGPSDVTTESLFESCLRLRPDRIFLSEIRGREVFAFLEAINSGHPGSLSTIHSDNPKAAFEQIYRKMRRYGDKADRCDAFDYLKSIINIVVQLKRCPSTSRHMYVSEIYYDTLHKDNIY